MIERDQLAALQGENARLIALLDGHGIEWRLPPEPLPPELAPPVPEPEPSRLSTAEKVALFRRLFRGRTDVYPIHWESKTTGNPSSAVRAQKSASSGQSTPMESMTWSDFFGLIRKSAVVSSLLNSGRSKKLSSCYRCGHGYWVQPVATFRPV